ncbi:MAG: PIG-L deacetylase family protein [Pyrinomonadaceae bacterium]
MSLIPWYRPRPEPLLVVAPHPDDETIGCGGLLSLHSALGGEATVLFLTCSEPRRRREAEAALSRLAVKSASELNLPEGRVQSTDESREAVEGLLLKVRPKTIMLPSTGDPHPDHRSSHTLVSEALLITGSPHTEILLYEGFTPLGNANTWLDITAVADQKWAALGCYESQQERYRIVDVARNLNAFRGLTTMRPHVHYAEAFLRVTLSEYLHDRAGVALLGVTPGRR